MPSHPLLSFDEARRRVLAGVQRLGTERLPLASSDGRVLAEDVRSPVDLPRFDASAMDGYALAQASVAPGTDGRWSLPVHGEAPAGGAPSTLVPGTAMRIFTGAMLPSGADTVVMQEHVRRTQDGIEGTTTPTPRANVRWAGEDLARTSLAVASGTRITPGVMALLAMLDAPEITVARAPRITLLCTGDELRGIGTQGPAGTLPESNAPALAALARRAGAVVTLAPIAKDTPEDTDRAVQDALAGCDLLVTVGGVSVGDHDHVRGALERNGVSLDFWRVAIKPGKPLAYGLQTATGRRVLALPGNPASSLVTFGLFGMGLVRALQGDANPFPPAYTVLLGRAVRRTPERLLALLVALDTTGPAPAAMPHGNQSSGSAVALARSDGLALIPAGDGEHASGTHVPFVRWSDL